MGSAWRLIEDRVLGSAASTITFNTGLTDFNKFRLTIFAIKDSNAGRVRLQLNGDSGTNYAAQRLSIQNTTVQGARVTGQGFYEITAEETMNALSSALIVVEIQKPIASVVARMTYADALYSSSAIVYGAGAGIWGNTTDLISTIDVISASGNFAADTRVVLEGFAEQNITVLAPVTYTLTTTALVATLGTPALALEGSYTPQIVKKSVG